MVSDTDSQSRGEYRKSFSEQVYTDIDQQMNYKWDDNFYLL